MKRILVAALMILGLFVAAPASSGATGGQGPANEPKICRPTAVHRLVIRLERQEAAGHDRRCLRMERHLAMLQADCDSPVPRPGS